nr:helix-turn-helix transcriptional regulator [Enterococcus innesii]
MSVGEKIKNKRNEKNYTQEDLANLLHVSRSTISSWEVGRTYPDLDTVVKISDLLGITLDELLKEPSR